MLPLHDTQPNRYSRFPYMTVGLIVANTLIMIGEQILAETDPEQFRQLIYMYGSVPHDVLALQGGGALSAITTTFLHGGLIHLVGNMSALWVFGRRVEDACGPWRFLCYYLLSGIIADVASTIVQPGQTVPSIGASGAVFGLMGAYLLLYPSGRIRTLIPLIAVYITPAIPAVWIILYYLAVQLVPAFNILVYQADYQVGYWAHLGGFFSCLLIFLFLRPEALKHYLNEPHDQIS